jgi:cobalt-zinc-cadmium efflux system protein
MSGHSHASVSTSREGYRARKSRLQVVLVVTVLVLVGEVIGALFAGSVALAAEAGHLFADASAAGLALTAIVVAERQTRARSTFGLYRLEILASAFNGVVLLAVAVFVVWTAISRLSDPPEVRGGLMTVVAAVGLAANAFSLWWLQRDGGHGGHLTMRSVQLEVLGDLLGSAAVLVAGLVIALSGELVADPLASLLVAALIVPRTWSLLREAFTILSESSPADTDLEHVRAHICEVPGVVDVHDLHVWTISSGRPVMSAHVVVEEGWLHRSGETLDALQSCLAAHFDVEHSTFQIEPRSHSAHEAPTHP